MTGWSVKSGSRVLLKVFRTKAVTGALHLIKPLLAAKMVRFELSQVVAGVKTTNPLGVKSVKAL